MSKPTWKTPLKEDMRRIKLIKETQEHNRDKCECEGCKWYNIFGTIIQNGIMFHVEKEWKKIPPKEWHISFSRFTNYRSDKKVSIEKIREKLRERKVPPDKIEAAITQVMLDMVPHVVFTPTPQGVLREV